MATIDDPRPPTRKELAEVFGNNQRLIRAFEQIFDLIPSDLISQQTDLTNVEFLSAIADQRSVEAIDAINRLADAIEALALAPNVEQEELEDHTAPLVELGTIAAQNEDAVEISGGTIVASLTDDTTNLIASSTALTDGAAASAGTLTNAPSAGDPTKWVAIDDNGTTRYIPAW